MDFIFAAPEIWTISTDADVKTVIGKALPAFRFEYFTTPKDLRLALNDSGRVKPSMVFIDVDPFGDEALKKELVQTPLNEQKIPLILCGQKSRVHSFRAFFELGVVSLLIKPFVLDEVAVRLELAALTASRHVQYTLSFLRSFGAELTSTELKILFCFLAKESHSIARNEIMKTLWEGVVVHPKTLDVHLFNLRKKLSSVGCQIVSGRGGTWTLKKSSEAGANE
jgi:DNA-binding response OmpR family regulator